MIWVIVFASIAAAGLLMVVGYAVWLAHKASDVFAELRVLADRGGKIGETLSRIEIPAGIGNPGSAAGTNDEYTRRTDDPDQIATPYAARRAADDVG